MTKEELDYKFDDCFNKSTFQTGGGYEADTTSQNDLWQSFLPHILEYAKQEAIAFHEWSTDKLKAGHYIDIRGINYRLLSSEQQYNIYIKSKS